MTYMPQHRTWQRTLSGLLLLLALGIVGWYATPTAAQTNNATLSGEQRQWHRVTLSFDGPQTNETATPNPFTDYRLLVTFTHAQTGTEYVIPGFYAADGNAAESSAESGNQWQARFAPPLTGTWNYTASFRQGNYISISLDENAGSPVSFDGASGSFDVAATNKTGDDFRAHGLLQYVGKHHLQFAGSGKYFLKGGADSPENFMAYDGFDGTYSIGGLNPPGTRIHSYDPHAQDWNAGDPDWKNGAGRNIIGMLNYLAEQGGNSVYFLTYNLDGGDGRDTWMWINENSRTRFDVSKLDQWEIVFEHMDRLGIQLHVVLTEMENWGNLGGSSGLNNQRKLYYRELIARFGHHMAVQWNIGEENNNSDSERRAFANYIRAVDPYDHHITFHTLNNGALYIYDDLYGFGAMEAASLQGDGQYYNEWAIKLREATASAGQPWAIFGDEQDPRVPEDMNAADLEDIRKESLWGNLMGGGAGVEWYFGYQGDDFGDVQSEDWRIAEPLWQMTALAIDFFHAYLPFWEMEPDNALLRSTDGNHYALAKADEIYVAYLWNGGGNNELDLRGTSGTFDVYWYNPRTGGALQTGNVTQISGGSWQSIGQPPNTVNDDWTALVTRNGDFEPPTPTPTADPTEEPTAPPPTPTGTPEDNDSAVTALTLVDATADQRLFALEDNSTVNLAELNTSEFNIEADVNTDVGSVVFRLNGAFERIENFAPYTLKGDSGGDYNAWSLAPGTYTVEATPYSENSANGSAGQALSITFTVVEEVTSNQAPVFPDEDGAGRPANPPPGSTTIQEGQSADITVFAVDPDGDTPSLALRQAPAWMYLSDQGNGTGIIGGVAPLGSTGTYLLSVVAEDSEGATATLGFDITIEEDPATATSTPTAEPTEPTEDPTATNTPTSTPDDPATVAVTALLLVDAVSDTVIRELNATDTIDLATLPSDQINIVAQTDPQEVGKVVFTINGGERTENFFPYVLYGDVNGSYNGWTPMPGDYAISATPYDDDGNVGTSASVQLTVTDDAAETATPPPTATTPPDDPTTTPPPTSTTPPDDPTGVSVEQLVLVDAVSDTVIRVLGARETINLAELPSNQINVVAQTNPVTVGKVVFTLNGNERTESFFPYVLYGDDAGDFNGWTPQPGTYVISATPYDSDGTVGNSAQTTLTVVTDTTPPDDPTATTPPDDPTATTPPNDPTATPTTPPDDPTVTPTPTPSPTQPPATVAVTHFVLVNADTNTDVIRMGEGMVIDLSRISTNAINIRAEVSGAPDQVIFQSNVHQRTESFAPFAAWGDADGGGNYYGWQPDAGSYTLTATPYKNGQAGTALTINFSVING